MGSLVGNNKTQRRQHRADLQHPDNHQSLVRNDLGSIQTIVWDDTLANGSNEVQEPYSNRILFLFYLHSISILSLFCLHSIFILFLFYPYSILILSLLYPYSISTLSLFL